MENSCSISWRVVRGLCAAALELRGVLVAIPSAGRIPAVTCVCLLGCAIGSHSVAWKSRHLSKSVAGGAMKNIGKVPMSSGQQESINYA